MTTVCGWPSVVVGCTHFKVQCPKRVRVELSLFELHSIEVTVSVRRNPVACFQLGMPSKSMDPSQAPLARTSDGPVGATSEYCWIKSFFVCKFVPR